MFTGISLSLLVQRPLLKKNGDIKYEETPRERKLGIFSNGFKK